MDTPIFDQVRYLMDYCHTTKWECSLYYGAGCEQDHFVNPGLTDF